MRVLATVCVVVTTTAALLVTTSTGRYSRYARPHEEKCTT